MSPAAVSAPLGGQRALPLPAPPSTAQAFVVSIVLLENGFSLGKAASCHPARSMPGWPPAA